MKNLIKSRWFRLFLIPMIAIFAFTGFVMAQNQGVKMQDKVKKTERFRDADRNQDGFINQNEYQFNNFGKYDVDSNGKLSRKEYKMMNRDVNCCNPKGIKPVGNSGNTKANFRGNGQGNGAGVGQGNGPGNGTGTGVCPSPSGNTRPTNMNKARRGGSRG